jgi:hypothetical protein
MTQRFQGVVDIQVNNANIRKAITQSERELAQLEAKARQRFNRAPEAGPQPIGQRGFQGMGRTLATQQGKVEGAIGEEYRAGRITRLEAVAATRDYRRRLADTITAIEAEAGRQMRLAGVRLNRDARQARRYVEAQEDQARGAGTTPRQGRTVAGAVGEQRATPANRGGDPKLLGLPEDPQGRLRELQALFGPGGGLGQMLRNIEQLAPLTRRVGHEVGLAQTRGHAAEERRALHAGEVTPAERVSRLRDARERQALLEERAHLQIRDSGLLVPRAALNREARTERRLADHGLTPKQGGATAPEREGTVNLLHYIRGLKDRTATLQAATANERGGLEAAVNARLAREAHTAAIKAGTLAARTEADVTARAAVERAAAA